MNKIIIICEGRRDRIFLHEAITYKLSLDLMQVKTYSSALSLVDDIRRQKQMNISIAEGPGFPRCVKVAVRLCRQLWYSNVPLSIGVIADSDHGPVYKRMIKYLTEYLQTPCKKHNVSPELNRFDSEQSLTVSFGYGRNIIMWTLEIPRSLDIQISNSLKREYSELGQYTNEDKIIEAASAMFKTTQDDVVRRSVILLENENWFKNFCKSLEKRIARAL